MAIKNVDRTAGAMLSGEIAKRYRHKGLKEDTIRVKFTGTAGQILRCVPGARHLVRSDGDGNDYVGKGLWVAAS